MLIIKGGFISCEIKVLGQHIGSAMKNVIFPAALSCALVISSHAAGSEVTATQAIDALEERFGVTHGQRRNHIKGICAAGSFVGNPETVRYSRSDLFSGKTIPVVARFSISGGNLMVSDATKSPRGMALQFRLDSGAVHHITMLNTPIFGASTPEAFVDHLRAARPDPVTGKPNPELLKDFYEKYPKSKAQADFLASNNPPVSYANSSFWGIHTFKFINKDDQVTLVRWQFVPRDGEKRLTDREVAEAKSNFLESELFERVKNGPIQWDMIVTVGQPGDTEIDPTASWPSNREKFKAGTLTLTSAMPQSGSECEAINYDPLVMSDGVAPTNDPILLFRSPSYAISFGKRLSEK